MVIFSTNSDLR